MSLGLAPGLWLAAIVVLRRAPRRRLAVGPVQLRAAGLVPDRIRGRMFAFDFALITLSLGISSLLASSLADRIGPRPAVAIAGGIALAWAGIWWLLTRAVRREPLFPAEEPASLAFERPAFGAE